MDKGRKNSRGYVVWTDEMDEALLNVFVDHYNKGDRAQNGWKPHVYTEAVRNVREKCSMDITKDNIISRSKTFDKHYAIISKMLSRSGFGWDWNKNKISVDSEDVWNSYVKLRRLDEPSEGTARRRRTVRGNPRGGEGSTTIAAPTLHRLYFRYVSARLELSTNMVMVELEERPRSKRTKPSTGTADGSGGSVSADSVVRVAGVPGRWVRCVRRRGREDGVPRPPHRPPPPSHDAELGGEEVYEGNADDEASPTGTNGQDEPHLMMRARDLCSSSCTVSVLAVTTAAPAGDEPGLYRMSWSRREEWSMAFSLIAEVRRKRGGPEKATLLGKDVLSLVVQPAIEHAVAMAMLMISNSCR